MVSESHTNSANGINGSFGSLSPFDPIIIQNIVEALVLSKYGTRFQKTRLRSSTRRCKRPSFSSTSSDSDMCYSRAETISLRSTSSSCYDILENSMTKPQNLVNFDVLAAGAESSSLRSVTQRSEKAMVKHRQLSDREVCDAGTKSSSMKSTVQGSQQSSASTTSSNTYETLEEAVTKHQNPVNRDKLASKTKSSGMKSTVQGSQQSSTSTNSSNAYETLEDAVTKHHQNPVNRDDFASKTKVWCDDRNRMKTKQTFWSCGMKSTVHGSQQFSSATTSSNAYKTLEDAVTKHQKPVNRDELASKTESSSLSASGISSYLKQYEVLPQPKKIQSPVEDLNIYFTMPETNNPTIYDSLSQDLYFDKLNDEIFTLSTIRNQILKAIHFDDLRKRPTMSAERLEAERLLLINDTKISLLSQEKPPDILYSQPGMDFFGSGIIKMSKMRLWCDKVQNYDEFFICVVTCGTDVQATEVSRFKANGIVYFKSKFKVASLKPHDILRVKIYSISSENKRNLAPCLVCECRSPEDQILPRESLFRLWGQKDEVATSFTNIPDKQILFNYGVLAASVSTHVSLKIYLTAFANVSSGSSNVPMWRRQWMVLEGKRMQFFTYPKNYVPHAEPTDTIELTPASNIRHPLMEECVRKLTIYVRVNEEKSILISFDLRQEFDTWWRYLTCAMSHIRTWEKW